MATTAYIGKPYIIDPSSDYKKIRDKNRRKPLQEIERSGIYRLYKTKKNQYLLQKNYFQEELIQAKIFTGFCFPKHITLEKLWEIQP